MADLHLDVDRASGGLAAQVAAALRSSIRSGRLTPGTRLPASRELARDLSLSRGVVVEAYEQLVAEGFLESQVGAGTRVAAGLSALTGEPEYVAEPAYGYRATAPDLGAFPRQAWLKVLRQVLATLPNEAFDYPDPGGVPELREELAGYLKRVRAAAAEAPNIVIMAGVAQGLSLVVAGLGAGAVLAMEDPTSDRQVPLVKRSGATVVGVPVDDEGIDVRALARTGARAVLVTPAHQFPTGVVLSPRRRAELVAWARRTGALILEDDYDAEFRFDRDPVGCLQGLAPERVVLTGSVSKSLAPGLRLGWLVAPPAIAQEVRRARGELDLGSPVLDQHALARLIGSGAYDRHLRRTRREYRTRRDALVTALARHFPDVRVTGISAGLHLFARLDAAPDAASGRTRGAVAFAERAQRAGLAAEPVGEHGVVIGFARLPAHRIARAVREMEET